MQVVDRTSIRAADARQRRGERLVRLYAARRCREDFEAAVTHHLPLARRLARRYARPGVPTDDLQQVACVGLVKAVRRFDVRRGTSFRSFAIPTIVGELKRHCRDMAWSAHVPRPVQERVLRVRAAAGILQAERGCSPTVRALAACLDESEEDIVEALVAATAMAPASLDGGVSDEDGDVVPRIERLGEPDPGYERVECLTAIEDGMVKLDPTELELLRLRYVEDLTHDQIAGRLDVPLHRVGRGLDHALERVATAAGA